MRYPQGFPQSSYESLAFIKQKNTVYAKMAEFNRNCIHAKPAIVKTDGTVLLTQDQHIA